MNFITYLTEHLTVCLYKTFSSISHLYQMPEPYTFSSNICITMFIFCWLSEQVLFSTLL